MTNATPHDETVQETSEEVGELRACPWISRRVTNLMCGVASGLNAVGAVCVCAVLIIICADIASRGLLNHPLPGVAEAVAVSVVVLVFLQLASTLIAGKLTRIDFLTRLIGSMSPKLRSAIGAFVNTVGATTFGAILYGSVPILVRSWKSNEFLGVQGTLTIPAWPAKAAVVAGSGLMVVIFVLFAVACVRQLIARGRADGKGASL
jgi:TRAP-type C4-dicarboxylate transport system permease small subunit